MTGTDLPLKMLVRENIHDIASWLLKYEIVAAEELSVELTTETLRVDLVFRLELVDQRNCIFHLEFQGRRSKPEMPRRQLNHLSRLALQSEWPFVLESYVLYTEKYAGNQDMGQHQIKRLDGSSAIAWNYTPVHLWREPAEPLLAIDRRGIIPLMGLMRIQQPETTLPQMVERIRAEPDEAKRRKLFTSLLALIGDEEYLAMLEKLVDSDEYILDTPFLRRLRRQGAQEQIREDILKIVDKRFTLPEHVRSEIGQKLTQVEDLGHLDQVFTAALDAETIEVFMAVLNDTLL